MKGSHFSPGQGTVPKIEVQFWGKVAAAGYTPPFFGHGRVKVGVDQSAVSVSHCKKVGTLLCRFSTTVYPVVSFTLYFFRVFKADSYGNEKLERKWPKSVCFFWDQKYVRVNLMATVLCGMVSITSLSLSMRERYKNETIERK